MGSKRVCVVVLGDFERSPRMKNHTLSLEKLNYHVDVVAYKDTQISRDISENSRIHVHPIKPYSSLNNYLPKIINYFIKTLLQSFSLLFTLLSLTKPNLLLLQNPPSIPTLPIVWFYSKITGVKFVIDWHNYGFTILGLSLGNNHPLVKLCRWCEGFFGSSASYNLCVSNSMLRDLDEKWNIKAITFHDRPTESFKPLQLEDKYKFMLKMAEIFPELRNEAGSIFFEKTDEETITIRKNRPCLLFSGTSWTEDEDFSVLLDALEDYDADSPELPELICVITGKGPLKSFYEEIISKKRWTKVKVILPWLESEDYPKMIAIADIGVSLHTSSSQLDLPMKIVDMFGCCVPVLAISFKAIDELVKENHNGRLFDSSKKLAAHLKNLLKPPREELNYMRKYLLDLREGFSWEMEWNSKVKKIFS